MSAGITKIKDAEYSSSTLLNTHSNIFTMNSSVVKTEALNIKKEIIEDENLDVNEYEESIDKHGISNIITEIDTEVMKIKHTECFLTNFAATQHINDACSAPFIKDSSVTGTEEIKKNDINIKKEIIKTEKFEAAVNTSSQESNTNIKITCIKSEKIISYSSSGGSYQCRFCDYQTENHKSIINHIELHSNECKPPSNVYVLRQPHLKQASESKCALENNKSCTSQLVSNESSCSWKQRPQFYEPKTYSKKKVLTCQKCNYSTVNISFFERHLNNHTVTEITCNSYDSKCLKPYYKFNSNINSSKETFFCKYCDFVSANEYRLIHHEKKHLLTKNNKNFKRHIEKKEFLCEYCDFKCFRKVALINHERRIHTGEKPYACLQCDYRTTIKRFLVLHTKIHGVREPLMCKLCDYKCLRPPSLVNHVRKVHTGERPFVCAHCNLGFTLKRFLVGHLRAYTGDKPPCIKSKKMILYSNSGDSYQCSFCDYQTENLKSIINHVELHSNKSKPLSNACVLSQPLVKQSSGSKCALKSNNLCASQLVSNDSSCRWKQRPQFYGPKTYSKKKV